MRIALAALLAGSLGASQIVLAQAQTTPAPSTAPSTAPKRYLVISRGGFLGLFETEVMVPLEDVAAQGDRIVLRNLTEEQVKGLPKYTTDDKTYRELDDSETVSLSEQK